MVMTLLVQVLLIQNQVEASTPANSEWDCVWRSMPQYLGASDGDTYIYAMDAYYYSTEYDPLIYMAGKSRSSTLVQSTDWRPILRTLKHTRWASTYQIKKYYLSTDAAYTFEAITALRRYSGSNFYALFSTSASSTNQGTGIAKIRGYDGWVYDRNSFGVYSSEYSANNYGLHFSTITKLMSKRHFATLTTANGIDYLILGGYDGTGNLILNSYNFERTTLLNTDLVNTYADWEHKYTITSTYSDSSYTDLNCMVVDTANYRIYASMTVKASSSGDTIHNYIIRTDANFASVTATYLAFGSAASSTTYSYQPQVLS